MFQADFILASPDPVEITKRLQFLPKDLTAAYYTIFDRLNPGELAFAHRILLGWIFHAQRLLSMSELQHTLVVEIGVPAFNPQLITESSEILRICGGLIGVDEHSKAVVFSNETVKPFLRENKLQELPSHLDLAKTCLTYIQFLASATLAVDEGNFGKYAVCYFPDHTRLQLVRDPELEEGILELLSSQAGWKIVDRCQHSWRYESRGLFPPFRSDPLLVTLFHLNLSLLVVSPLPTERISRM
jgi:hypothetical protein